MQEANCISASAWVFLVGFVWASFLADSFVTSPNDWSKILTVLNAECGSQTFSGTIQVRIPLWPIRMAVLRWIKLKFSSVSPVGVKTEEVGYYVRWATNPCDGFWPKPGSLCPLSCFSSSETLLSLQRFSSLFFLSHVPKSLFVNVAKCHGISLMVPHIWRGRKRKSTQQITVTQHLTN